MSVGGVIQPLIDVGSLASELAGGAPPVLLDVRWRLGGPPGIDSYRAGHLPGAVFVDLDADLAGPPGAGGRHPLPAAADFEAAMRRAGVRTGYPVVTYDDGDSTIAARAWWMLRYFGHDQVRVLDGGFRAWAAAGQPVTTERAQRGGGRFHGRPRPPSGAGRGGRRRAGPVRRAARREGRGAVPRRDRADRSGGRPHPRGAERTDRRQRRCGRPVPAARRAEAAIRQRWAFPSARGPTRPPVAPRSGPTAVPA